MKRLLALALTCLLAACSSQHRVDPEPDFANSDPAPDETPEPRLGEIESLISQAKLEIKRRDYDEAGVKLHQVFRRDRWYPEANTIYQDLQISRGQGDALYQEYLDLYEKNKQRGDAFWFHLRPLLIKRGIKAVSAEVHKVLADPYDREFNVMLEEYRENDYAGPLARKYLLDTVTDLLKSAPPSDHMRLIESVREVTRPEMARVYAEWAEENPQSGDALSLLGLVIFVHEVGPAGEIKSLDAMRAGWILELPGANLPAMIARVAYEKISYDLEPAGIPRIGVMFDKRYSLMNVALNFYRIAALSDPKRDFSDDIKRVQDLAERHKFELEDLSLRK